MRGIRSDCGERLYDDDLSARQYDGADASGHLHADRGHGNQHLDEHELSAAGDDAWRRRGVVHACRCRLDQQLHRNDLPDFKHGAGG